MDTSELEGEVDHSFFDSDCDEPGDGKKETGRSLEAEKKSLPTHQSLYAATTTASFPRTDETENESKEYPDQREEGIRSEADSKDSANLSREEDWSRASSALSMASSSQKVIDVGSDIDESNWHSKKSSGTFMAFLAETSDAEDKDMYRRSSNENLDETLPSHPTYVGSGKRNETSHRKVIAKQCYKSPSRTSGEASAETESRSSSERLSTPMSRKSSSSLSKFRTSFSSQDLAPHHTSKETELNVSPVSFGGVSPRQSQASLQGEDQSAKTQQEGSAPSSGLNNMHQEDDSYADMDECSVRLDSQLGEKLLLHYPGRRTRKNFSFSNDEVRRIDRENQRLLRELSRLTTRPRSVVGPRSKPNNDFVRPSHSALNRQRDQRRIESENQAFLKRLDSVKPTPGLRRLDQLANYQRQIGYLGGLPSHPMLMSGQRKESYTLDASRR